VRDFDGLHLQLHLLGMQLLKQKTLPFQLRLDVCRNSMGDLAELFVASILRSAQLVPNLLTDRVH
jgi:hypothetical protein